MNVERTLGPAVDPRLAERVALVEKEMLIIQESIK